MTGLSFDDLRLLHLGWIVLGLLAVGLVALGMRRRAMARFAAHPLLARLTNATGSGPRLVRLVLAAAAMSLLVGGLIGPRWGEQKQQLLRRNIDIVILLDVSKSMLATDIAPSRLERAKLAIRDDLLPALGGDRVGLIVFAGATSIVCPLTSDYGFFRLALADVTAQAAPRGGTLIGDAIRRAGQMFDPKLDTHKIILLISDGEDHDSYPVEAARGVWEDLKIPIIAVAIGDPQTGSRIPLRDGGANSFLQHKGESVLTRADFETLRRVAEASPLGVFVPVGTSNFDLGAIYRKVAGAMRATEATEERDVRQPARFHLFAVGALCLVMVECFMREGPPPRDAVVRRERTRSAA